MPLVGFELGCLFNGLSVFCAALLLHCTLSLSAISSLYAAGDNRL